MKKLWQKKEYLIISLFSISFFLIFYGAGVLNPQNIDWFWPGDLDISQHYAGWLFFCKEGWHFPIGNFTGLSYPNEMSIIYMDSIPLLAMFFKLFRQILPSTFQYFGGYQLLCFILQGIFAVKILKKYISDKKCLIAGAMLFVMAPIFLWRVFLHVALSSHWILLLALMSIVYYEEYFQQERIKNLFWMLIGFFCTTIHLYFLPMCFIIFCGFSVLEIKKKVGLSKILLSFLSFLTGLIVPMLLLGGFMDEMSVAQEDIVWKKSFNLNAFLNPQKWSSLVPDMELYHYGQSEGFAYLGAGIWLGIAILAVMLLIAFWGKKREIRYRIQQSVLNKKAAVCVLIFFACIIAAASPDITFGRRLLFSVPVPQMIENIWSIFRCSGRLVWPSVYLLMTAVCIWICRWNHQKTAFIAMLACVLFQAADIGMEIWDRGSMTRAGNEGFESELTDEAWEIIGEHKEIENIVYVNVSGLSSMAPMAEFADRYGLTLGNFYYARDYSEITGRSAAEALKKKEDRNLFLFDLNRSIDAWNEADLFYYVLDGKLLGYGKPIEGLKERQVNIWDYEYHYTMEVTENTAEAEMINGFLFLHENGC